MSRRAVVSPKQALSDLRALPVSLEDVEAAHARIRPHIRRTPVLDSPELNERAGATLFFKCENLQRGGAFKMRGALNAVLCVSAIEAGKGVATHSSGNHGAALAIAAAVRGIPAHVVVPRNVRPSKRAAIVRHGANVIDCEPTLEAREQMLAEVVARTGATFVPPYDDARVIAGQGTAALELIEDVADLDQIWVPVGGGGLAAGTAIAVAGRAPQIRVVGAEPAGADDAFRSLRSGQRLLQNDPRTSADGLRTSLGELNFAVLERLGVDIVLASEPAIVAGAVMMLEQLHTVVEPSSAVPFAALLESSPALRGARIGIIVTGGNLDRNDLSELIALSQRP